MIDSLSIETPLAEVHRLLGYPAEHVVPERVQVRLDALLEESRSLVEARGTLARFPVAEAEAVQLTRPGPANALGGFALGLVTIGPGVEARAATLLRAGDASGALLLDAIGSAAAEAAADALGSRIAVGATVSDAGEMAISPCRVSPGYGDWPLSAQEAIFARLPHKELGVQLLPSLLMVPRKSVTFALWFDAAGHAIGDRRGCSCCPLDRCPRQATRQRGKSA
jgi:cobalamin-dependent methionine synthase I